jgi:hypothetical protein
MLGHKSAGPARRPPRPPTRRRKRRQKPYGAGSQVVPPWCPRRTVNNQQPPTAAPANRNVGGIPTPVATHRDTLVMRRSGVRFPKAAQFKTLISSVCSMSVDRHGQSTPEATHIRSGRSCPALTADRGAVAVTEFDDSPSAGGDQQARRTQADRWIGIGGLDPGRVHDLVAALGDT